MMAQTFTWPVYFATKPLKAARMSLKKGQAFPIQEKHYIRGLGRAYGVANAETLGFTDLPYVAVVNVQTEDMARHIIDRGVPLDDAHKLVEAGGGK